jgi:mycothiol synthase
MPGVGRVDPVSDTEAEPGIRCAVVAQTLIHRLDPADDRLLARVHKLLLACHQEASPGVPYRDVAETAAFFRHPPPFEARPLWIAGDVDGFAWLKVAGGSSSGWLELAVSSAARRRGIGRALFETAAAEARAFGCVSLAGRYATPGSAAFACALGARDARRDVTSILELSSARLDRASVSGYRLESWVGSAPERLVASFAAARNAINDAPQSTEDESEVWTVATVRGLEAAVERRGRELRVTVAIDADDSVAAFTELRLSPDPGTFASTEDTATVASHRGRGLAGWVKAESLTLLRAERPRVRLVTTTNAAENVAILAVNRRLGFEPTAFATTANVSLEAARVQ